MTLPEIQCLGDIEISRYRNLWESTRQLGYFIVQTQSSKKLSPSDILSFSWDEATERPKPQSAKEIREQLNKYLADENRK